MFYILKPGRQRFPERAIHVKTQTAAETALRLKECPFFRSNGCAEAFGFRLTRISGSHHIFVHPTVPELINLQNVKGKAKPYQIKQLLQIVERYNLQMEE
jgi:predicted RNA binding protein YcfA (HicA-like mRNA interferase family)